VLKAVTVKIIKIKLLNKNRISKGYNGFKMREIWPIIKIKIVLDNQAYVLSALMEKSIA
jgi:hypothetical protein